MPQRHRPELSEVVVGEPFVGYRRSTRTFGRDRVCAHRGCATRLSMYNSGEVCARHASFGTAVSDATLRIVPPMDVPDMVEGDQGVVVESESASSPRSRPRRPRRSPHIDPPAHLAAG